MRKIIRACLLGLLCGMNLQAEAAKPDAPLNLIATPGNAAVNLAWTPPSGTILIYNVYSGLTYTALTLPSAATQDTWASVLSLQNGNSYKFAVSAVNAEGEGEITLMTAIPAVFPAAPAGVTATAVQAAGWQVQLTWQAASQGTAPIIGYQIYRSQDLEQAPYAFSPGSNTLYLDTAVNTLTAASIYDYWVAAVDQWGNTGAVSAAARVDVLDASAPLAPGPLQAAALNGRIDLQWTAGGNTPVGSVDGYYVFYRAIGGPETRVAVEGSTSTSTFSIALPNNGETYALAVAGVKNGKLGPRSEVSWRTLPPKITGLTSYSGNGYFQFAWDPAPASAGVTGYLIYGDAGMLGGTVYTHVDVDSLVSSAYYAVAAVNASGDGERSNSIAAAALTTVPAPPRDFTVTTGVSKTLDFSWRKNSVADAVSKYTLHALDGPFSKMEVTAASAESNTVSVYYLNNGQSYRFFLTAQNSSGDSAASITLTAIPMAAPDHFLAAQKTNALALTWQAGDQPAGVAEYALYQVVEGLDHPLQLTRTARTFFIHAGLADGAYGYQLVAVNSLGQTSAALTASGTVAAPPDPPATVRSLPGDRQVQINWLSVSNALSYNLYRTTIPGFYGQPQISGIQANKNSDTDRTDVVNTVKYYYSLSAVNDAGESGRSAEVAVIPFRPARAPAAKPRFTQLRRSVRLEWEAAIPGDYPVIGYNLYRSRDGGGSFVLQPAANGTSPTVVANSNTIAVWAWDDPDVDYGGRYVYRLHAVDEDTANQIWHEGTAYPILSVRIDQPQNRMEVYRNAFNPGKGEWAPIQLMQVQPGRSWVKIYNAAGEHIRTLFDQDVGPGFDPQNPFIVFLTWDGKNSRGETAASGVYLIHAEGQSSYRQTRKVALIK